MKLFVTGQFYSDNRRYFSILDIYTESTATVKENELIRLINKGVTVPNAKINDNEIKIQEFNNDKGAIRVLYKSGDKYIASTNERIIEL